MRIDLSSKKNIFSDQEIELKSKNGILRPEQKEFLLHMESQNYFAMTCFSIESAIATIEWYCF